MTPDAAAVLLLMQNATTIHDAHNLAVEAVKAGASSDEVSAAINAWMDLQRQQVQQVFSQPRFRRCWCTRPVLSTSLCGCCCANHDSELAGSMDRHPAGKAMPELPQTADITRRATYPPLPPPMPRPPTQADIDATWLDAWPTDTPEYATAEEAEQAVYDRLFARITAEMERDHS